MAYKLKSNEKALGSNTTNVTKAVNLENRSLSIVGSSEDTDREGDQILLSWDLKNYSKNPVFLWAHNYASVPLATATRIIKKQNPKQLLFDLKFSTEGLNPFADMILGLYNEKIINASSVGFIPHDWEDIKSGGRKFKRVELLELSGVPIPSNPAAIALALKSSGVNTSAYISDLLEGKLTYDFLVEENREDIFAEFEEMGEDFQVVNENDSGIYAIPKSFTSNKDTKMTLHERKKHIEKMLAQNDNSPDAILYFQDELKLIEKQMNEKVVKSFPLPSGEIDLAIKEDIEPKEKRLTILDSRQKVHQAISVKEKLADFRVGDGDRDFRPGSAGRILRACIIGNTEDLNSAEFRAFSEGTASAGGFLLPEIVSTNIIDLARNKSQVQAAGAWTMEMTQPTLTLVKVATDPTAYWRAEAAAITESSGTFEPLILKAMALGVLCRVSMELVEDSPQAAQKIEESMASAISLEMDRIALLGDGVGEPTGLDACDSINTYDMGVNGLAPTNYDPFSYASQYIENYNFMPNAVIMAPRDYYTLDRLKQGTTNDPSRPPRSYERLNTFTTNQIPITDTQGTATTASKAFLGDFTKLLYGVRRNISVDITNASGGSTGVDAFSTMQLLIRAYMRLDVAVLQERAFTKIFGLIE